MKRDESIYLQHILDAIAKVESYLQGVDETAFSRNTMAQDAVIRQIEIIGEATKHLSDCSENREGLSETWRGETGRGPHRKAWMSHRALMCAPNFYPDPHSENLAAKESGSR